MSFCKAGSQVRFLPEGRYSIVADHIFWSVLFFRERILDKIPSNLCQTNVFRRLSSQPWTLKKWFMATSFPGLLCEDEGRDEKALVWAGQFCILIARHVVKHGLDSLVKHGLDPISKTWTRLVKHGPD